MESYSFLFVVLVSSISFLAFNKSVFAFFPPPVKYRDQWRKRFLWTNICTSWIHSVITAFMAVLSLCKKPSMLEDMINSWNTMSYYTLALSTGYFVYDFIDLIVHDRQRSICIMLHHVIVIYAFLLALLNKKYISFGLVSLLMEVNSIFLHSRQLMRMSDVSPVSMLYKINGILLIITFLIFRLVTCGWMFNFIVMQRNVLPTLHFMFGTVAMCVLTPQNIFLLKQIWKSDYKHSTEKELHNTTNNNIMNSKPF